MPRASALRLTRTRLGAVAAVALLTVVVSPVTEVSAAPARTADTAPGDCGKFTEQKSANDLWAQTRLHLDKVSAVATGANVRVAVVDSGVNYGPGANPQIRAIRFDQPTNLVPKSVGVSDCVGHGTAVTGIIAARPAPGRTGYVGVAPGATIIPIKYTNSNSGSGDLMAAGIEKAIRAGAQVINVSSTVATPPPALAQAVADASSAKIVLVASAGNTDDKCSPCYPAKYSQSFTNVIAVTATDRHDNIGSFAVHGTYIDLAAPGADVEVINKFGNYGNGYLSTDGTSFAAPFVTGAVALLLQHFPGISPAQIRTRLEASADPSPTAAQDKPGAPFRDNTYGFGVVDPYLALTAVGSLDTATGSVGTPKALPAPVAPTPPDRHLQHLALGIGLSLLALAIIAAVAAGVVRSDRRRGSALS